MSVTANKHDLEADVTRKADATIRSSLIAGTGNMLLLVAPPPLADQVQALKAAAKAIGDRLALGVLGGSVVAEFAALAFPADASADSASEQLGPDIDVIRGLGEAVKSRGAFAVGIEREKALALLRKYPTTYEPVVPSAALDRLLSFTFVDSEGRLIVAPDDETCMPRPFREKVPDLIRSAAGDTPLVPLICPIKDPRAVFLQQLPKEARDLKWSAIREDWLDDLAVRGLRAIRGARLGTAQYVDSNWQKVPVEGPIVPDEMSDLDAALLLAATGTVEHPVPLGLALLLRSSRHFAQSSNVFRLSVVAQVPVAVPLPTVVPASTLGISYDQTSLELRSGHWRDPKIVAPLMVPRVTELPTKAADSQDDEHLRKLANRLSIDHLPLAYWHDHSVLLLRPDDVVVSGLANAGLKVRTVAMCADSVVQLLRLARAAGDLPKGTPDPVVASLVRGILVKYTFATGTCPARNDDDPAYSASPDRCLVDALALLRQLAEAPIRDRPAGPTAKLLLTLQQSHPRGFAWPLPVAHAWRFKLRTQDHTWLEGEVFHTSLPSKQTSSGRKRKVVDPLNLPPCPAPAGQWTLSPSNYETQWTPWFGTKEIRCRVYETRW